MRKTGKWIAGVLLAMGMILAGTVSGCKLSNNLQ